MAIIIKGAIYRNRNTDALERVVSFEPNGLVSTVGAKQEAIPALINAKEVSPSLLERVDLKGVGEFVDKVRHLKRPPALPKLPPYSA